MPDQLTQTSFIELTADIVAAYVSKNSVPQAELPALIVSVYTALNETARGATGAPNEELKPAVPIKKSVSRAYLICLDDGKKFKSLKRHLRTNTISPLTSIVRAGTFRATTQWWPRTMHRRARR